MTNGKPVSSVETCGDVDDPFIDPKRSRIYVSCGAGFLDVFEANGSADQRIAHLPTVGGARTSLFVPEMSVCRHQSQRRGARGDLGIPAGVLG